jgi:putative RNA 2'-phosphotransferase
MADTLVRTSKFLSLVLRHEPGKIGLELDPQGWVSIEELLSKAVGHLPLTAELLHQVVRASDKQRFAISEDGTRIRANQGHSVPVELGLAAQVPPEQLYHGTATRFLDSIRRQGLLRGKRHHVHLSADTETAVKVGVRHGQPVVLIVQAGDMHRAGHAFFRSDNGVWLVEHVPPSFLVST